MKRSSVLIVVICMLCGSMVFGETSTATLDKDTNTTDSAIAMQENAWRTELVFNNIGERIVGKGDDVFFNELRIRRRDISLTLYFEHPEQPHRVIAVDKEGNVIHPSDCAEDGSEGTYRFKGMGFKDIAHYKYQVPMNTTHAPMQPSTPPEVREPENK